MFRSNVINIEARLVAARDRAAMGLARKQVVERARLLVMPKFLVGDADFCVV